MKNQIKEILSKKKGLNKHSEYIAAFADGTVSEVLTDGTIPPPEEGDYVRILYGDGEQEIKAKLGSMI